MKYTIVAVAISVHFTWLIFFPWIVEIYYIQNYPGQKLHYMYYLDCFYDGEYSFYLQYVSCDLMTMSFVLKHCVFGYHLLVPFFYMARKFDYIQLVL